MTCSLRSMLIIGTSVCTGLVLIVAGTCLYFSLRATLIAEVDRALLEKARLIAANFELDGQQIVLDEDWKRYDQKDASTTRDYVAIWSHDNQLIYSSPALQTGNLKPFANPTTTDTPWQWMPLSGNRVGRSYESAYAVNQREEAETKQALSKAADEPENMPAKAGAALNSPVVRLLLIRDAAELQSTFARILWVLIVVGGAAIASCVALLAATVGRGLRPLTEIASEIQRRDAEELSSRIDESNLPSELVPLVKQLNDLFARLDDAFDRERAFSAEVAHELRTPLAGLRSILDVALRRPRHSREYQEALSESRSIAIQLQSLVENLLSLARLESGAVRFEFSSVDVEQLLRSEWLAFAGEAERRHLQVQWAAESKLFAIAEQAHLSLLIRNLFCNAADYANEGGRIQIKLGQCDDVIAISIANSGSNVPLEQADRIFQRFWRGDEARTDTGVHFGLGLSLAKKIAGAMRGSIRVNTELGGEFKVIVLLPACPPQKPNPRSQDVALAAIRS